MPVSTGFHFNDGPHNMD